MERYTLPELADRAGMTLDERRSGKGSRRRDRHSSAET